MLGPWWWIKQSQNCISLYIILTRQWLPNSLSHFCYVFPINCSWKLLWNTSIHRPNGQVCPMLYDPLLPPSLTVPGFKLFSSLSNQLQSLGNLKLVMGDKVWEAVIGDDSHRWQCSNEEGSRSRLTMSEVDLNYCSGSCLSWRQPSFCCFQPKEP